MAKQPAKGRTTTTKPKKAPAKAKKPTVGATPAELSAAQTMPPPTPIARAPETPVETPQPGQQAVSQPTQDNSGGFWPMVLGGLVAGGIGFGIAYFTLPQADPLLAAKVTNNTTSIVRLRGDLDAVPALFDDPASARAALDARMTEIERQFAELLGQPAADGALSGAAIAAYQLELSKLRDEVQTLSTSAVAELRDARDTAASIEQNAQQAALAAVARAALARVHGAIESGAPMGAALDELAAALQSDIPADLAAVRDGTPRLGDLQSAFPDAARNALAVARAEGASGEATGGFTAFLRDQFDVRSTTPKEGADADAVLSRAEDALRNGRLSEALAELGALPEVARGALTDWRALAELRAAAQAAADDLTTQLNAN